MALINCKEYGKEISDQATFCPNCGSPVKNTKTIGIEIAKDPNTITHYNCTIYKIENNSKIKIAQCREEQSINIECTSNMQLQFDFDMRHVIYNVEPREKIQIKF